MHTKFWLECLRRRDHSEVLDADGRILKWILKKQGVGVWNGFIWLRISTGGGRALVNAVVNLRFL
jgi:hypothetical protein